MVGFNNGDVAWSAPMSVVSLDIRASRRGLGEREGGGEGAIGFSVGALWYLC